MNIARNTVHTLQCTRCPHIYIMVGNVPISLSKPQKVSMSNGGIMRGTCPNHPRKGVAQDA